MTLLKIIYLNNKLLKLLKLKPKNNIDDTQITKPTNNNILMTYNNNNPIILSCNLCNNKLLLTVYKCMHLHCNLCIKTNFKLIHDNMCIICN